MTGDASNSSFPASRAAARGAARITTILGIDPGTTRAGYGVIKMTGAVPALITAGTIKISPGADKATLLAEIRAALARLCEEHKPDAMAIEKLFFSKNRKTALAVAESRGVTLLAGREAGLKIYEYSPNEVKMAVTGFGGADKKAVLKMVRFILKQPNLKVIDDASDALALAIVAGQELRLAGASHRN